MVEIKIKISDDAFNLLLKIYYAKCAEYRDSQYGTVEEYLLSDSSGTRTIDSYLLRNFGGTHQFIPDLLKYNLIEEDWDAWHTTYRISDIGKEILEPMIRKLKLEKLK